MIPCGDVAFCGIAWHSPRDVAACMRPGAAGATLGDRDAVREYVNRAAQAGPAAQANAPASLHFARVMVKLGSGLSTTQMMVRGMDDIFVASMRFDRHGGQLTLHPTRARSSVLAISLDVDPHGGAPVSSDRQPGDITWLPDRVNLSWQQTSMSASLLSSPATAPTPADAAGLIADATNWRCEGPAVTGDRAAATIAHLALAAVRKGYVGALLSHMRANIASLALMKNPAGVGDDIATLGEQVDRLGRTLGIVSATAVRQAI